MNSERKNLYCDRPSTPTLLSDADRYKVLELWNDTQSRYPKNLCVHQLFEAQVERTPDAIAVVFEDQSLTYRELNQRANQLAHYLRTLGVAPEVIVGIYLDRSIEMIVGLLGILKAGGAYVPLDPTHPADRLSFILADTQASVILTQSQWVEQLSEQPATPATIVSLDTDWEIIAQNSVENPFSLAIASDLIYTIYTSGSTGQPKGVLITHAGICNQLHWRQTTFPLTAADRVLQNISFSFDPSVWQIFWALCYGAQLILPRPDGHKDTTYLVQLIAQQQISVIALVPSMLRVLLEEKGIDRCTCLKHVFCGGEALTLDLQERFFERFNLDRVLHNVYGPTEASIDATFWTVERGVQYPVAPIGRPIANAQIYILDADLQPVPIGEAGELHIGGDGLARGYLNRPELTKEKFIPHPFSPDPEARLYKTGDLARYLPDGNIEFLGRIDHQVKIRGFRIELGEIEAALNHYPGIEQSVAIAREDIPGNKRLVAYLISTETQRPNVRELRQFLQEKLPEYMVPSAFVWLDAFPLNPNGKVDRHKLPAPEPERPDLETFIAPQNALELELTQIWEAVLNVQPIGVNDNFFELGGNSLNAARLLNEVETQFHKKLPISTFLQAPTIAQLSELLRQEEQEKPWKSLVPIQPDGSKPPLFFLHTRNGNVLGYYRLTQHLGADQPCYGLELPYLGQEDIPPFQIETLAAAYIQEIQMLQPHGPYFLCGYSFGGLLAYEIARQLQQKGHRIAMLALLDTYNSPSGWFKPLPRHVRVVRHLRYLSSVGFKERVAETQRILARKLRLNKAPIPVQPLLQTCPVRSACEQATSQYSPQVYSGRAILFRATKQPAHSLLTVRIDRYLGWKPLITGNIELHELPCHHFNMLAEPTVKLLAEKLQICLAEAQAEQSKPITSRLNWRDFCPA
jgi:amino acid adenylation domain-containing protein